MITPEYCQLMARYNRWMNERLYALLAPIPDDERKRDRGARHDDTVGSERRCVTPHVEALEQRRFEQLVAVRQDDAQHRGGATAGASGVFGGDHDTAAATAGAGSASSACTSSDAASCARRATTPYA